MGKGKGGASVCSQFESSVLYNEPDEHKFLKMQGLEFPRHSGCLLYSKTYFQNPSLNY